MEDKLHAVQGDVDVMSKELNDMVNVLLQRYVGTLDEYMKQIDIKLGNSSEVTMEELEGWVLNLPSLLYFASSALESLSIKEDVCKTIRTDVYNRSRELASGTVADKNMSASLACQTEDLALLIYSRAVKKMKARIDAAYEMLNSIKKVINYRVSEMELSSSKYIGGGVRDA